MHIIELLKNVESRGKSDHIFGISAINLVAQYNFNYFQNRCIWIYSIYEYIIQKFQCQQ